MDTTDDVTKNEVPSSSSSSKFLSPSKKSNAPTSGKENDEALKGGDEDKAAMLLTCASNDGKDAEERGDDAKTAEHVKQNIANNAGDENKTRGIGVTSTGDAVGAKSTAASTLHTLITNLQRRQLQQQQHYRNAKGCVDKSDDNNLSADHAARCSAFTFAAHDSDPAATAANSCVKNNANQSVLITPADIIAAAAAAAQQQNSEVESNVKCKGTGDATKIAMNRSSMSSSSNIKKTANLMGGPAMKRIRRMNNNNNNHTAGGAVSTYNNTVSPSGNTSAITFPVSNSSTSPATSKSTSAEHLGSLTALNGMYSSLTDLNGALAGNGDNMNGTGMCSRKLSSLMDNKSNDTNSNSDNASSPAVNSLEYLLQLQTMYQTTLLNNMLFSATSNSAAASSPTSASSYLTVTPTKAQQLSTASATAMLLRMQHLNALQQSAALTLNLNTAPNTQQLQQQLLFPSQNSLLHSTAAGNGPINGANNKNNNSSSDVTASAVGNAFAGQLLLRAMNATDLAGTQAQQQTASSLGDSHTADIGSLSPSASSASSINSLFLSAPSLLLQQQNAAATAVTNNPFILAAALNALPSNYNNNELFNESTTNKGSSTSNQPSSQFDAAAAALFCNLMQQQQQQQYASNLTTPLFPLGLLSGTHSNAVTHSDYVTDSKQTITNLNSSNTPQNITDSRCVASDVNMSTNELLLSALAAARMNATAGGSIMTNNCKNSSKNEKSATTSLPTGHLQQIPICRRTLEARFARILAQELEAASDEEHHDTLQLTITDNTSAVNSGCGDKDGTDKDDELLNDDDKINEKIDLVNEKKNNKASSNGDSRAVDINETSRSALIIMDNKDASGVVTNIEDVNDNSVIDVMNMDAKMRNEDGDSKQQHLLLSTALLSSDHASEAHEDGSVRFDHHRMNISLPKKPSESSVSSQFSAVSSVTSSKSDDISQSSSDQTSSSTNNASTSTQSDVAKTPALLA